MTTMKYAITDVEGTLAEVQPEYEIGLTLRLWNQVSGRAYNAANVEEYQKLSWPQQVAFLQQVGFKDMRDFKRGWFTSEELSRRWDALQIDPEVTYLGAFEQMGLVTSANPANALSVVRKIEALLKREFVPAIYIHAGNFPDKPDPTALNAILGSYQGNKEEAFYLGDLEKDMQSAHNAGIMGVLIDRSGRSESVATDKRIRKLRELASLL